MDFTPRERPTGAVECRRASTVGTHHPWTCFGPIVTFAFSMLAHGLVKQCISRTCTHIVPNIPASFWHVSHPVHFILHYFELFYINAEKFWAYGQHFDLCISLYCIWLIYLYCLMCRIKKNRGACVIHISPLKMYWRMCCKGLVKDLIWNRNLRQKLPATKPSSNALLTVTHFQVDLE